MIVSRMTGAIGSGGPVGALLSWSSIDCGTVGTIWSSVGIRWGTGFAHFGRVKSSEVSVSGVR